VRFPGCWVRVWVSIDEYCTIIIFGTVMIWSIHATHLCTDFCPDCCRVLGRLARLDATPFIAPRHLHAASVLVALCSAEATSSPTRVLAAGYYSA
jgi:hypothetical protein